MEPIALEPLFNVQGSALLGVLFLASMAAVLWMLGVAFAILLARGNVFAARQVGMAGVVVGGFCCAALAGFSFVSGAREMEAGSTRPTCEIDGHRPVAFGPGTTAAVSGAAPLSLATSAVPPTESAPVTHLPIGPGNTLPSRAAPFGAADFPVTSNHAVRG